jgi:hypothetical protein
MLDDWITDAVTKLKIQDAVSAELGTGRPGISVVDWRPLIQVKSDNASFELDIWLSDETADLVGKKGGNAAFIRSRGILQVNPDKGKRLLSFFPAMPSPANKTFGKERSGPSRSKKTSSGSRH